MSGIPKWEFSSLNGYFKNAFIQEGTLNWRWGDTVTLPMRHKEIWGTETLNFKTVFTGLLGEKEKRSYKRRASRMCFGRKRSWKQLRVDNLLGLIDAYLAMLKNSQCFIYLFHLIHLLLYVSGITVGSRRQKSTIPLYCF